jgi:hypothetical protein
VKVQCFIKIIGWTSSTTIPQTRTRDREEATGTEVGGVDDGEAVVFTGELLELGVEEVGEDGVAEVVALPRAQYFLRKLRGALIKEGDVVEEG